MTTKRPVNLQLTTMKFPVTAISSILHRISGIFLFLLLPFALYLLDGSLASESHFEAVQNLLHKPAGQFFAWVMLSSLTFHLVAGVRHLLMDFGIGETLRGGRLGAWSVLAVSAVGTIAAACWVW